VKPLAGQVWRDFRFALSELAVYEALMKLIGLAVFAPLSAWLFAAMLRASGRLAISNTEILDFALSPIGLATLLVLAAVAIAIGFAEQSGLLLIAAGAQVDRPVSAMAALAAMVHGLPRFLLLALSQVAVYAVVLAPFLIGIGATYFSLLAEADINFYLARKPPEFLLAFAIAAVLSLGLAAAWATLYVVWIFALPACVFDGDTPRAALRRSRELVRGRFFATAKPFVAWAALMSLLGMIVEGVLWCGEWVLLSIAGTNASLVAGAIAMMMLLHVIGLVVATFVGFTSNALLVARLYAAARERRGEASIDLSHVTPAANEPNLAWLFRRRVLFAGAAGLLVAATVLAGVLLEVVGHEIDVEITGHRGAAAEAPENTIAAIEKAIEAGADYCEIDVQESADGVLVVVHDADLKRVANVDAKIHETTCEDLRKFDVGVWFSDEFKGEKIPTLDEVIEVAKGRIKLNIELKYNGHDRQLATRVAESVARHEFEEHCVLTSLKIEGLREAKRANPQLKIGLAVARALGDLTKIESDFLSVNADFATAANVDTIQSVGKEVHIWTVNDRKTMLRMIDLGVDNIITDDPRLLYEVREQRADLSPAEKLLLTFEHWRTR
jgi:glycerophosphoryl diester phosphodiesterase